MKRSQSFFYHILIFVLAQVAWLSVLGIWIYWYVTNYIIFNKVDEKLSAKIVSEGRNVFILVGGLLLLITISVLMSLLFHRLNIQFNLTRFYDNFIANITHELKSPLASIQLSLETLQLHRLSGKKQKDFIYMMLKDAERLNKSINAILDVSALEQKKIAHDFQVYPIGLLIRELAKESRIQFNLPENSVSIKGEAECQCVVDRGALKTVLDNLVDNSIKYSVKPAKIALNMYCGPRYFCLEYSDQGIGMSQKNCKKVFEKFFRVQNAYMPSVKGTGLGLYWTREIIKFHGGSITASSKGKNKGTSFHIELPIYQASKNRHIQNLLKLAQKRQRQEELNEESK